MASTSLATRHSMGCSPMAVQADGAADSSATKADGKSDRRSFGTSPMPPTLSTVSAANSPVGFARTPAPTHAQAHAAALSLAHAPTPAARAAPPTASPEAGADLSTVLMETEEVNAKEGAEIVAPDATVAETTDADVAASGEEEIRCGVSCSDT
eukprot:310849-Pleurochrysis_carterae.AAC.2